MVGGKGETSTEVEVKHILEKSNLMARYVYQLDIVSKCVGENPLVQWVFTGFAMFGQSALRGCCPLWRDVH